MATDDPMMASVAGRYAWALFEIAKDEGKLGAVEQDLARVQALLDGSDDLRRMVRSPVFSAEEQGRALDALLGRLGVADLTSNFFKLLARNRRLFAAPDMLKAFRSLVAREKGLVEADVASAHPLTDEQLALLMETLKASVGKDVVVHAKVDPALLGGLVVKMGSRMVDSSLRTKLNSLKLAMKGTG